MSNLLGALQNSMRKSTPKVLRGRANMIAEVVSYGETTIKVKALNGPIAGQVIDIEPGAKSKVADFDIAQKRKKPQQTDQHTEIGGVLRFDGVTAKGDGTYKASWTNAWVKAPGEEHMVLEDRLVSYNDTGRKTRGGQPLVRLSIMEQEHEAKVSNLDELEAKLTEAFKMSGGAMVIDINGGEMEVTNLYVPGERVDGVYVRKDAAEHAKKLLEDLGDEVRAAFSETLAGRGMTVVPVGSVQVGSVVAEETVKKITEAEAAGKQARIMSVNPYAYERPTIGVRLTSALAREGDDAISKEHAERLKDSFLAGATEAAKAAFHKDGWKGVSDTDLKEFFAANGVQLANHPDQGWNRAALHLQRYENGTDFFVAKSHETARYGAPYPALECTKELRSAYGREMTEAVLAVTAPEKLAEVKEAAKNAPAEDNAELDETAPGEILSSVDDMLDAIGDEITL